MSKTLRCSLALALCWTATLCDTRYVRAAEPGDVLWEGTQTGLTEGSSSHGKGVAIDPGGNILVTGFIEGADGNYDILTCKYSPIGEIIWSRTYDYSWHDVGAAVASDADGNVIVAGSSQDYQSPINIYLKTYYTDYVILKYSPDGQLLFDADASGNGKNNMPSSVVCGPDGSIYVTGQARDAADTRNAFYTVRFDPSGTRIWERIEDWGTEAHAAGAVLVPDGLVVSGHVWDAAQADYDIKTVKYDPDTGEPVSISTYRPPGQGRDETAHALASHPDGRLYIAGRTSDGGGEALTLCLGRELDPLWTGALYVARRTSAGTAVGLDEHGRVIVAGELREDGTRTPLLLLYGPDGALDDERVFFAEHDFLPEDMAVEPDGDILLTGVLFGSGNPDVMKTVRLAGYPSDLPKHFDLQGTLSADKTLTLKSPPMPMLRKVRLSALPVLLYGCLPATAVVAEPVGMPDEYEFRFFVTRGESPEWEPVRAYSPVSFFMIAPGARNGNITGVMVQVRSAGSDMEYQAVEYMDMDKQ